MPIITQKDNKDKSNCSDVPKWHHTEGKFVEVENIIKEKASIKRKNY